MNEKVFETLETSFNAFFKDLFPNTPEGFIEESVHEALVKEVCHCEANHRPLFPCAPDHP